MEFKKAINLPKKTSSNLSKKETIRKKRQRN